MSAIPPGFEKKIDIDPEADRLTQLQTCLDQLVVQFYSSLNYINHNHDFVSVEGEPKATDTNVESKDPEEFKRSLKELAKDVILKTQQVEHLVDSLPGVDSTEQDQLKKLQELEQGLRELEKEHQDALKEKERLLDRCDELILQVAREKVEIDREPM
ncbi:mediator of RNA polymerase II transcription subunit 21 [Trichomonascus vanleenenianus]|uniref:Srb7p n=1 Tax=Trichomonascus vanleenenianus TaxID=2268995 RepID=UPI003ECA2343